MTYDGLDRLTDATSPMYGASGAHYTYDVLDNVTRIIAPGRDQADCYDVSWRLTNVKVSGDCSTGSTILGTGFDVQGNLANWNGVAYTFDYGNRLRAIAGLEAYRYDAWGRRTRSSSTAGLVESLYGRDGQLLYQRDARTSRRRQYVYLAGSLVAEHDRPLSGSTVTVTYQHTDALGTPVATTDAARALLQRSEYEPYGKLLNRPLEDGPAYTGHVSDAATSLVYMQQRYYDPRTARFWSVDPVTVDSAGGNFNRYWYANDNPYRFADPDGRQACANSCMIMRATADGGLARGGAAREFASFLSGINGISGNHRFESPGKAAIFFDHIARNSANLGWEVGANIMRGLGGFYASDFHTDFDTSKVDVLNPSSDDQWFAVIHTHPGNDLFTGAGDYWNKKTGLRGSIAFQYGNQSGSTDIASAYLHQVNAMVTLQNGGIWLWDYGAFQSGVNSGAQWTVSVKEYFRKIR